VGESARVLVGRPESGGLVRMEHLQGVIIGYIPHILKIYTAR
jgi:hypothetical protein